MGGAYVDKSLKRDYVCVIVIMSLVFSLLF